MTSIGFVGAGLIGNERIKAFGALAHDGVPLRAAGIVDPYSPQAKERAASIGAPLLSDVDALLNQRPDLIVIAVPHDIAHKLTAMVLQAGIRVLLEKPIGRNFDEGNALRNCQCYPGQLLIGHNYRFFKGVQALFTDLRRGFFGTPISLSFLLGHGGSPGDVKGWKLDPVRAGGGCLIDPGIHLLDLACQAEHGNLTVLGGSCWKGFWKTGIEEDCQLILRGITFPTVSIDVSVVRWRSTFRIELFGTEGYGLVEGRGRSYGPQVYRRGVRWGWRGGRSQIESEELVVTTSGDEVFEDELRAVLYPTLKDWPKVATVDEALQAMALLKDCRYELGLSEECR
jgi:predicted dehydrogenase